jgi:cell volume regulation protein A
VEFAHDLILLGAGMIVLSILAGLVSTRFGAPLLLVFLGLGMLAGEDGPGGIDFDDFGAAYLVGSIALAIILFDGGLRTSRADMRLALAPAAALATVGVVVTAAVTGLAAMWLLDVGGLEGFLVGSLVASTDAAAVFFLLHQRGLRLRDRTRATLEVEAGLNDPMAIFLTITCVDLLTLQTAAAWTTDLQILVGRFALETAGGILVGIGGGAALLFLINRLNIAQGLYPVLAVAGALTLFAGAQQIGASGFLAVYLAGYVVGSRRHRATQMIHRFHDGLAWLAQIAMFLILGLLVDPSELVPTLAASLGVAVVLIFVARPLATALCLVPLRFEAREIGFISWVGLRGAVPIYLGTIPILSGVAGAEIFFTVVFAVVIASLAVQGWTLALAGRRFGVVLPPRPDAPARVDIDLPGTSGPGMAAYTVQQTSLALRRPLARLPLPPGAGIVSVVRDGIIRPVASLERLSPGDYVLLVAAPEQIAALDFLFGGKPDTDDSRVDALLLGEFMFPADANLGAIADTYGFRAPAIDRDGPVGAFLTTYIPGKLRRGRRLRIGNVELIVREVIGGVIAQVGLEVEPDEHSRHRFDPIRIWAKAGARTALAAWAATTRKGMDAAARALTRTR